MAGETARRHLQRRTITTRSSLSSFQWRSKATPIRHTIINMQYVEDIAPWVNGGFLVRLDSGSEIEVSRRQGQLLKEQMTL